MPVKDLALRVHATFRDYGIAVPRPLAFRPAFFRATLPVIRLFSEPRARKALGAIPIFLDYLSDGQSFSNDYSARRLESAGVPSLDPDAYLPIVLAYYLARHIRPGDGTK